MILANDDRARTLHAAAERTQRHGLPDVVAGLLKRNDQRRAARRTVWRKHCTAERARQAAYERFTAAAEHAAERGRDLDVDGFEL